MSNLIREFSPEDMGALIEMHRSMGMSYPFPELMVPDPEKPGELKENPLFVRKMVYESQGKVRMAMLARLTAECYYLRDPEVRPDEQFEQFKYLHREMERALFKAGLDDLHCWPPPEVEKHFGKRLEQLRWVKETWPAYCLYLDRRA